MDPLTMILILLSFLDKEVKVKFHL